MLNVKLDKGVEKVEIAGNIVEILSDVTALLKIIHDEIGEGEAREFFKKSLKDVANDEIYAKNEEELDKIVEEKQKAHNRQ